jgi:hypothetical protein
MGSMGASVIGTVVGAAVGADVASLAESLSLPQAANSRVAAMTPTVMERYCMGISSRVCTDPAVGAVLSVRSPGRAGLEI